MKKLLLVSTALTAFVAGPAHAGPVAAAVAWVGSTLAAGGVAAGLLRIGLGIGMSLLSQAMTGKMGDKPKIDVSFNTDIGDDTPLAFVLGDYPTSGKRKYIGSWGKNNRYITEVIEVSSIPQGLKDIWINEGRAMIDWSGEWDQGGHNVGFAIRNYDRDAYPRVWFRYFDGTQTEACDLLTGVFGGDSDFPWTAEFVGTGKAYIVITSCYDKDTLASYPTFLIEPEPLPLYDPRKDSTAGGLGSHRWGDSATYEPSNNAAVMAYNVGRGIYYRSEWIFGGKNLPAWRLPFAEWVAAMNACDDLAARDGGGSEPAYRAGAEITSDMEPLGVMEEIGRAANMRYAEVGGMLKPIVGLPGSAVYGITDEDIIITEGQSFQPFYTASETFNAISATYPEPGEKWTSKDAPEYIDAVATAEDGGRYLPTSVSYAAAPYAQQVQRLMRAQMQDYRRMRRHTFHLPPEAYGIEPLVDMISWTSARNGYVNKQFVVESVAKAAGMNVLVTVRECDPGDYDWNSDWEQPVVIVPPVNVIPFEQAVPGFTAVAALVEGDDGQERPAIQIGCDGGQIGVTDIRIQARRLGVTDPQLDVTRPYGDPEDGTTKTWLITDVLPATQYQVRAQLITELAGIPEWSGWVTVTTLDIRLSETDLVDELQAALNTLNEWITSGIPGIEGDLTNLSDLFRRLSDDLRAVVGEVLEGSAQQLAASQQVREYLATAEYTLGARVDVTDEQVRIVAAAVTALQSTIPNLATATALQALQTVVTQQGTTLTSLASSVTALQSTVDGKADATALSSLATQVTQNGDDIEAVADATTALETSVGKFSASGLFRVTTEATSSGALTTIGLKAAATDGEAAGARSAAMYLEAITGNKSRAIFEVDTFGITGSSGTAFPFIVDGGVVYIDKGRIRDADIDTLQIAGNAVTVPVTATGTQVFGGGGMQTLISLTISLPANTPTLIVWSIEHSYSALRAWDMQITRGATVLKERYNMNYGNDWPSGMLLDTYGVAGNRTYNLRWAGASNNIDAIGSLVVMGVKR